MSITRKDLLAAVVGGAIVMVLAGGVAWAAIPAVPGGVIQGCYDSGGNVKVVETLSCPAKYTPFQWNQQGPAGTNGTNGTNGHDGASVSSEVEAAGTNCAAGGSKFTAANNVTYACNGEQGVAGPPGQAASVCLSDGTSTPSVAGCTLLIVGGGPTFTLTNLTGAANGQSVTIFSVSGATLPDSVDQTQGNFFLAGDATLNSADSIQLVRAGAGWFEVSRSDNS